MTHEDYMKVAIEVAKKSEEENGIAIGAVIVKNDKVVATGGSSVGRDKDPSGHGESNCIRNACSEMQTLDLSDCILYGTLEPCGMCVSTAAWAGLPTLYFGAYREDVEGNDYEVKEWDSEKAAKHMSVFGGKQMIITGGILRNECKVLLGEYTNWQKD